MVSSVSGSASCASFMLFQAQPGRQAQLLPWLPRQSDRDGENAICYKYGGDAYLARVGGVPSFVETHRNSNNYWDNSFRVRVVPLRDGRWTSACAVSVVYGTDHVTSKVFLPEESAMTEAVLGQAAAQIVERRDVIAEAKDFSYGPEPSGPLKEELDRLMDLAGTVERPQFPAFGREAELEAGEEALDYSSESFPVILDGRAYLLVLGDGQLGCCALRGPLLVFYELKNGRLEPAGSAIVTRRRGKLVSASADPSR
jgi:hypothetical protein